MNFKESEFRKRGRGTSGKTIVFGLLKRGDRVYAEIVPNAGNSVLQWASGARPIRRALFTSTEEKGYDGLVDSGFDKHVQVHHGPNEFAWDANSNHWDRIFLELCQKDVWPNSTGSPGPRYWHLKETEDHVNHRHGDLNKILLNLLRVNSLRT